MQAEVAVQVQHAVALAGTSHGDAGTSFVVVTLAPGHHHVEAVHGAAQEHYHQARLRYGLGSETRGPATAPHREQQAATGEQGMTQEFTAIHDGLLAVLELGTTEDQTRPQTPGLRGDLSLLIAADEAG